MRFNGKGENGWGDAHPRYDQNGCEDSVAYSVVKIVRSIRGRELRANSLSVRFSCRIRIACYDFV